VVFLEGFAQQFVARRLTAGEAAAQALRYAHGSSRGVRRGLRATLRLVSGADCYAVNLGPTEQDLKHLAGLLKK
jgi:hypothetical protein